MNTYKVKLQTQEEVIDFVKMMGTADCNADIRCGNIIVDACSLLGVLSIGLNKILDLVTYGDAGSDFEKKISQYAA
ncbi:MAG: HPr family phosphocarrier protein [Butyrivibrio sp.]